MEDNKFSIITYTDDKNSARVYINRNFMGWLDTTDIIMNLLKLGNAMEQVDNYINVNVYYDDLAENDKDKVDNLLRYASVLTEEQEMAILNRQYENL